MTDDEAVILRAGLRDLAAGCTVPHERTVGMRAALRHVMSCLDARAKVRKARKRPSKVDRAIAAELEAAADEFELLWTNLSTKSEWEAPRDG